MTAEIFGRKLNTVKYYQRVNFGVITFFYTNSAKLKKIIGFVIKKIDHGSYPFHFDNYGP
jgi:hypothetical protein